MWESGNVAGSKVWVERMRRMDKNRKNEEVRRLEGELGGLEIHQLRA